MNTHTQPGKDLSLPQLLFAFNEELRRVAYSPLFTLEAVSQLDRDASAALASIREWKNSFAPINRIPLDVLSLIPTHLSSQKDRFHAASVCRHWRGTLLKHGVLWSKLFLGKGEECVLTLLERAKGSALGIVVHRDIPDGTMPLISPRAHQIQHLEFTQSCWQDIIMFSELNSGQLPLLRTLKINVYESDHRPPMTTPPSHLFIGSVDLEQFAFTSAKLQYLNLFVFPNLTTFDLSVYPAGESSASSLLDFLEALPLLQTVNMYTNPKVTSRGIPQGMVVILPNVQTFSLRMRDGTMTHVFKIAAHISCPRVRDTLLVHAIFDDDVDVNLEMFPSPVLWGKIVHQYPTNTIEEVTFEINDEDEKIKCHLTFVSSDTTVVRFGFEVDESGAEENDFHMSLRDTGCEALSQAFATIREHPLLSHVKRLRVKCRASMLNDIEVIRVADKVRGLFRSLGSLDELIINGCDLSIFLIDFLDSLEPAYSGEPMTFPWIKELAILHPSMELREQESLEAVAKLAKAQHALGIPFESITVRALVIPMGLEEELGKWVNVVDCNEEWDTDSE